MAAPRPSNSHALPSPYGEDSSPNDAGYAQETHETITSILTRLQDPYGDMIRIHITSDPADRPVLLQRALIERVSPWLERWVASNMQKFGSRDLYLDTGSEVTRKMFLWSAMKRRIPTMKELEMAEQDKAEYQKSLIWVWTYARETEIAEVQNAVMRVFWEITEKKELLFDVGKEGLTSTVDGSEMRMALIDDMLEAGGGEVPERMLKDLEVERVFGWEEDYANGKRKFAERGGMRASVGEFLVEKTESGPAASYAPAVQTAIDEGDI